jgi:hypothetical protein
MAAGAKDNDVLFRLFSPPIVIKVMDLELLPARAQPATIIALDYPPAELSPMLGLEILSVRKPFEPLDLWIGAQTLVESSHCSLQTLADVIRQGCSRSSKWVFLAAHASPIEFIAFVGSIVGARR